MTSHEQNGGGLGPDEMGFEWVDDDELSPEAKELLDQLSVPIGRQQREVGDEIREELVIEVQNRLESLRVDGYELVDKRWITPELVLTPHILDDVHYEIYRARKRQPYGRFVSVKAVEVFEALHSNYETRNSATLLQMEQDGRAFKFLATKMAMDETSIYKAVQKGPDGAFAVRSLHRLMKEDNMKEFQKVILRAAQRRADEAPLSFEEVTASAVSWARNLYRRIANVDTSGLSSDQQAQHLLELRDAERAVAFGHPALEFIDQQIDIESGND